MTFAFYAWAVISASAFLLIWLKSNFFLAVLFAIVAVMAAFLLGLIA